MYDEHILSCNIVVDFFRCIMNISFLAILLLSYLWLLSLLELCGMVQQLQLNYLDLLGSSGIGIHPSKNISKSGN